MENQYHRDDDRDKSRQKRIRREKMRRKIMLRRIIIMGMILILAGIVSGGIAIGKAVSAKREQKETKETQETLKIEESKKEKTIEEQVADTLKTAKKDGYPQELINILDKNPETLDFVRDYPEKKDIPVAETIGDSLEAGEVPHLLQWDERWGYASYGTSTIAASGCGPTCMSMVVSGLTGDASITPYTLAKYSEENHYIDETNNTYWIFMNEAAYNWGIESWETMLDEAQLKEQLDAGNPIICSVVEGDFTTTGHFIVLTGYKEGKVTVCDPNSNKNSEKEWVFQDIKDQIKSMWVYSL